MDFIFAKRDGEKIIDIEGINLPDNSSKTTQEKNDYKKRLIEFYNQYGYLSIKIKKNFFANKNMVTEMAIKNYHDSFERQSINDIVHVQALSLIYLAIFGGCLISSENKFNDSPDSVNNYQHIEIFIPKILLENSRALYTDLVANYLGGPEGQMVSKVSNFLRNTIDKLETDKKKMVFLNMMLIIINSISSVSLAGDKSKRYTMIVNDPFSMIGDIMAYSLVDILRSINSCIDPNQQSFSYDERICSAGSTNNNLMNDTSENEITLGLRMDLTRAKEEAKLLREQLNRCSTANIDPEMALSPTIRPLENNTSTNNDETQKLKKELSNAMTEINWLKATTNSNQNNECPVCPKQESCPTCEKCQEQETCPVCEKCPDCPVCEECPTCPVCEICPEQEECVQLISEGSYNLFKYTTYTMIGLVILLFIIMYFMSKTSV